MLAAGLDGIRREMTVPEASEENLYSPTVQRRAGLEVLPDSLRQALDALEQDTVVCSALGPHISERFVTAKRLEWEDYRLEVTPWELNKYLSMY
jgi:glutamine synthetase